MVREVKEGELYELEVIDNELMQFNGLDSPQLVHLENDGEEIYGSMTGSITSMGNRRNSQQNTNELGQLHRLSRYASSVQGSLIAADGFHIDSAAATLQNAADMRSQQTFDTNSQFLDIDDQFTVVDSFQMFTERKSEYKICLMGAPKCGKTGLINCFIDNTEYEEEYTKTEFIDKYEQKMQMIDPTDGLSRNLFITVLDVGSEQLTGSLLLQMDAIVTCFDVTDIDSFYELSSLF